MTFAKTARNIFAHFNELLKQIEAEDDNDARDKMKLTRKSEPLNDHNSGIYKYIETFLKRISPAHPLEEGKVLSKDEAARDEHQKKIEAATLQTMQR